jgi:hypothetical protein
MPKSVRDVLDPYTYPFSELDILLMPSYFERCPPFLHSWLPANRVLNTLTSANYPDQIKLPTDGDYGMINEEPTLV